MSATLTDADRSTALRGAIRDLAGGLAATAEAHAARPDPRAIAATEFGALMATAGIPTDQGAPGLHVGGHFFPLDSAGERVILAEEGCRVGVDAFMSMPGPSMAGVLVAALGDRALQERFYRPLLDRPTWTFFAMTEPGVGTDATAMTTTADQVAGGVEITGTKCFIGNAARADLGVVFARTGTGTFAIDAFLTTPARPGFHATPMPTVGVPGAEFCTVELTAHPVPDADLLGRHLPRSRRGIRGGMAVFHALRPVVAAMSLGVGLGALDELADELGRMPAACDRELLAELRTRAIAVRELIRLAAEASDGGVGVPASAAKDAAHRFARDATRQVARRLGLGGLLARPRALSAVSNAWAVQFMEGTVDVQRQQVFQGLNSAAVASGWFTRSLPDRSAAGSITSQNEVIDRSPRRGNLDLPDPNASTVHPLLERPS